MKTIKKMRTKKNRRLLGSASGKNGNITVFFTDHNKKITTKVFPSKKILTNNEFKMWASSETIVDIKFHRKAEDKNKELKASELARKTQKESPKYLAKKAKRNKTFEERANLYKELAKKAKQFAKNKGKTIIKIKPFITSKISELEKTQNMKAAA